MEYLAKWVQTYQVIIAVLLGVIGWGAGHYFTLRAQKKNFLQQVVNTARLEIASHLRMYENFLTELNRYVTTLSAEMQKKGDKNINWLEEQGYFNNIIGNYNTRWILLFKEYQLLFPELNPVIKELEERNQIIHEYVLWFAKTFWDDSLADECDRINVLDIALKQAGRIRDQVGLIEDLLIYLQNKVLSNLTGKKSPADSVYGKNEERPQIRRDKHGKPVFINGSKAYPSSIQFKVPPVGLKM